MNQLSFRVDFPAAIFQPWGSIFGFSDPTKGRFPDPLSPTTGNVDSTSHIWKGDMEKSRPDQDAFEGPRGPTPQSWLESLRAPLCPSDLWGIVLTSGHGPAVWGAGNSKWRRDGSLTPRSAPDRLQGSSGLALKAWDRDQGCTLTAPVGLSLSHDRHPSTGMGS